MGIEEIEIRTAHSLMCLGLYTVCFESMVLLWKQKVYQYLNEWSEKEIPSFLEGSKTAFKTFKYCEPLFLKLNVLTKGEFEKIDSIRDRRNHFAHEGYNEMWSLLIEDLNSDLEAIQQITEKVSHWEIIRNTEKIEVERKIAKSSVSPCFFTNFIKKVAYDAANGILNVKNFDK